MADPVRTMIRFAKAVEDLTEQVKALNEKVDWLIETTNAAPIIEADVYDVPQEQSSKRGRPKKESNNG